MPLLEKDTVINLCDLDYTISLIRHQKHEEEKKTLINWTSWKLKTYMLQRGREAKRWYTKCKKQLQGIYVITKYYLKTHTEHVHPTVKKKTEFFEWTRDLDRYPSKVSKWMSNTHMRLK